MKRQMRRIKKGTLVTNKYALDPDFGVTTSEIEYHSPRGSNSVTEYVWVLWNNGEHCLFKIELLEVVREGG